MEDKKSDSERDALHARRLRFILWIMAGLAALGLGVIVGAYIQEQVQQ